MRAANVREVLRNFAPVFVSRGVVQISAYVDMVIASKLGEGAVAAMTNAQSIYTLPVSLFGMAVSAAELPPMSSALGTDAEVHDRLRRRLDAGLRQIAFFIVPSAMAFFALGDVIAAGLPVGPVHSRNAVYVWGIIVALLSDCWPPPWAASTLPRHALRDTRAPLRYASLRVALRLGIPVRAASSRWLGIDPHWGAAGLTASAGVAGWVEFTLLRRTLNARIGATGVPAALIAKLWGAAAVGAAAAWGIKLSIVAHPVVTAIVVLTPYGLIYFAVTYLLRVEDARRCLGDWRG